MKTKLFFILALLQIAATDLLAVTIDLSKLADYTKCEAKNGDVITGSNNTCTVIIAANATVTLSEVSIKGYVSCIQCKGSATIILADGTVNILEAQGSSTPAIMVGDAGTTLTIKGKGKLYAKGDLNCAAIGCSRRKSCGNINIEDGNITVIGGEWAAGIGSGYYGSCGTITIKGGSIISAGGQFAAGIGIGHNGSCGTITITKGVNKVTAYKGDMADDKGINAGSNAVIIEDESLVEQK